MMCTSVLKVGEWLTIMGIPIGVSTLLVGGFWKMKLDNDKTFRKMQDAKIETLFQKMDKLSVQNSKQMALNERILLGQENITKDFGRLEKTLDKYIYNQNT